MGAGILDFAAYLPRWRLPREEFARAWGMALGPGERSARAWDEDSLTMAIDAAGPALGDRTADALFFATTTPPFLEKQNAAVAAAALGLPKAARALDVTGSLRAGTQALLAAFDAVKSGSAQTAVVAVGDARDALPMGLLEQQLGDGAAAFVVGEGEPVAEMIGSFSTTVEVVEFWRTDSQRFVQAWEDRFIRNASYLPEVRESVADGLRTLDLKPADFARAVLFPVDDKAVRQVSEDLGFEPTQIGDSLLCDCGNMGAAHVPLLLAKALEESKAGDLVLCAGYGDGVDVVALRVLREHRPRRGVASMLASKRPVRNYAHYLAARRLIETEASLGGYDYTSAPQLLRDRAQVLALHGQRCRACGTVQFPAQRRCAKCTAQDDFDEVPLPKRGRITTFTVDILTPSPDPPTVVAIVDLDGGGRLYIPMCDIGAEEASVGMPVELALRRYHEGGGLHHYHWKARPVRVPEDS